MIPEERKQAILLKIRPILAKELEVEENKIELKSNKRAGIINIERIEGAG